MFFFHRKKKLHTVEAVHTFTHAELLQECLAILSCRKDDF